MSENKIKLSLKGLNCANCANKIEAKANSLEEVNEANLNFSMGIILLDIIDIAYKEQVIGKVKKIVNDLEPDVIVSEYKKETITVSKKHDIKLNLKGLDCANCANKIEAKVNELEEVKEANLNFSLGRISIEPQRETDKKNLIDKVTKIVHDLEPDVIVSEYTKTVRPNQEIKLTLKGLDCANCANKIEAKVNELEEVKEASLNFSLGRISIKPHDGTDKKNLIDKVTKIVHELEPDVSVGEFVKITKLSRGNNIHKAESHKHGNNHVHDENCCCLDECKISHDHYHDTDTHELEAVEEKEEGFFKKNLSLIAGIVLYITALLLKDIGYVRTAVFIISYLFVGSDIVLTACRNIKRGEIFDENFLMTVATIGALIIGEYPEAVAVMVFYQIGELFQGYAVNYSRKSITSLMNIRAEYANLLTSKGEVKVRPEEVEIDDVILIKPGERVALDGVVVEGAGFIDTSALTGESVPRDIDVNDDILSGSINLNSVIKVKVTKTLEESTISRILEMVENASSKKAPTEKIITKFCRYYTPAVVFSALALAIIPPLVVKDALFSEWIYRALLFLVVSCPCALVVSVPLGLFAGIGGASKKGILVKGGNYLEALKDVDTVVFDKTGTLTKGSFKVSAINAQGISKEELLEIAAIGESFSNHPIAQSIVNKYGKDINKDEIKNYKELSGHGIGAVIRGKETIIGNHKLMTDNNIKCNEASDIGTVVYIAIDGQYKGNIIIEDEIKDESKEAIRRLKSIGINKIVMLTGDNDNVAQKVGKELRIDKIYSRLLPLDKVNKVEELLNDKNRKGKLIFVGDGINDAPVLARADIGVAMGGIGSDAAIEAADVVLMKDNPIALADAIRIGRKTNKILWQNIIFSLVIKIGVLVIGALGIATMWEAVFADVGVTLLAVLNSMKALKISDK